MENEKEIAKSKRETREFLESLSLAELRTLLDAPMFCSAVLEHASESEVLAQKVDKVLDVEYQEMSPDEQKRVDALATHLVEKYEVSQNDEAGTFSRETSEECLPPDFTRLPAWLHLTSSSLESIHMSAQQEGESGWPLELWVDAEGGIMPFKLRFDWHLSFLVVESPSASDELVALLLGLTSAGLEFRLRLGGKVILGPLEEFDLSEKSSREQIVTALLAAGFEKPKVEKLS